MHKPDAQQVLKKRAERALRQAKSAKARQAGRSQWRRPFSRLRLIDWPAYDVCPSRAQRQSVFVCVCVCARVCVCVCFRGRAREALAVVSRGPRLAADAPVRVVLLVVLKIFDLYTSGK